MHIEHSSKKSRFFASGGGGGSVADTRPHIAKAKETSRAMRSNMPGMHLNRLAPVSRRPGETLHAQQVLYLFHD